MREMELPSSIFSAIGTSSFSVTSEVKAAFEDHGFILVRGLLDFEEIGLLKDFVENDSTIMKNSYGRSDGRGKESRLALWNVAGDDLAGVVSRSQKVAGTMQALLGGDEIYHYHSKLMMKNARSGGAKLWHQDYGYWYKNGCLFPDMGSVFIAIDKCTRKNSCLQVLDGSHKMGRIDHILDGEQAGADPDRLSEAMKVFPKLFIEMEAGDALFFHCNVLHGSDQNLSDDRRWVLISSYNQRRNNPVKIHHHSQYHPLNILPNSAIKRCQVERISSIDKQYMNPSDDTSAK